MALDKATVKNIATLARIRVEDDELETLADELSHILDWIEQLNEVDTDDVEPMTSVASMTAPLRPDEVNDGNYPDKILANAPAPKGGFFTVPKVIE